jgi:transcriptional regulator with XRE-family HTH domain
MSTVTDWVPSTRDFAARLVLVRHQMGWNLKEAALACGVKAQSWREWELENRKPRDYEGVCKLIAHRSGCSLIWLMTGIDNSPGGGDGGGLLTPRDGTDPPTGATNQAVCDSPWFRRAKTAQTRRHGLVPAAA